MFFAPSFFHITLGEWGFWRWSCQTMTIGCFINVLAPLFIEFAMTLQTATCLASDAVKETIVAVKAVSLDDAPEWEEQVTRPVLALANGSVGLLSSGWSRGLGRKKRELQGRAATKTVANTARARGVINTDGHVHEG